MLQRIFQIGEGCAAKFLLSKNLNLLFEIESDNLNGTNWHVFEQGRECIKQLTVVHRIEPSRSRFAWLGIDQNVESNAVWVQFAAPDRRRNRCNCMRTERNGNGTGVFRRLQSAVSM